MGFLSRKNKFKSAPVIEEAHPIVGEQHPIVEELEEMEALVPERPVDEETSDRPATGPVTAGDPPPPAVAKASSAAGPPTAPPVEERIEVTREPAPEATASPASEVEEAPAEPERFMPRDLLAPSRHEVAVLEPEVEAPVKHADVIAFANQKGGVAKTTTTLNLAVAFAESGYRVLCVDLDPQGNLTMSQGMNPDAVHHVSIREVIRRREVDVACSSIDLAGAEIAMSTQIGRERSLEKALKPILSDYDFICIDTPPSLGLLTINALTAANKVIVPVQCEYLSMRGLVQLQNTLKMIQENLNPDVRIEGILPTMLDTRTVHAKEAVEILEENFGELVFKSRIRKAIKFAEAPVKGASVLKYDPQSNAAGYYRDLAKEVLAHESA